MHTQCENLNEKQYLAERLASVVASRRESIRDRIGRIVFSVYMGNSERKYLCYFMRYGRIHSTHLAEVKATTTRRMCQSDIRMCSNAILEHDCAVLRVLSSISQCDSCNKVMIAIN